jgi:hypothetical protein
VPSVSNCFVQLAMQLQQETGNCSKSVLLHTQSHTIAGVAAGSGCKAYMLAEGSSLSMADVQELIHACVPRVLLGEC